MMRSIESASSVFYHSQDEDSARAAVDGQGSDRETPSGALHDSYRDSGTDGSPVTTEQDTTGKNRRRSPDAGEISPSLHIFLLIYQGWIVRHHRDGVHTAPTR